jgi:predicted dehydrogenase
VLEQRTRADGRAAFERGGESGPRRPVDTEDVAVVQFETDRGALGSVVVSQVSPGRKNRLWIEFDAADEALAFDQESPELLWRGRRDGAALDYRDRDFLSPAAARLARLPAGHPQGYADCFDAFVADVYAEIRGERAPNGVPRFADGRRAVQITEAVLTSAAADGEWTAVAADSLVAG